MMTVIKGTGMDVIRLVTLSSVGAAITRALLHVIYRLSSLWDIMKPYWQPISL